MSRTRRYLVNVSINYSGMALVLVAGFWLQKFLDSRLGQSTYGLWLIGNQVLMYLSLLEFGLMGVLTRETAYATGRAGSWTAAADLPEILGRNLRLILWQLPIVAFISLAVWWFLPAKFAELQTPLGWTLLGFVLLYPLRFLEAVLHGLQDFAFTGNAQIVSWVIATVATVTVVACGGALYGLVVNWLTYQTLPVLASVLRIRRAYPGLIPRRLPALTWPQAKEYLTKGLWVGSIQLADLLVKGSDLIIIGRVLDAAAVTPYSFTGRVLSVADSQVPAMVKAAGPALSELKAGGHTERMGTVCSALTQGMLLLTGLVVVGIIALNQGFITWWVGAHNYQGQTLTALLALVLILRHLHFTALFALFCCGEERRVSLLMLADGAVTVMASLTLVSLIGPLGAPVASVLGVCVIGLPLSLTWLAAETQTSVRQLLMALGPWVWRTLLLVALCAAAATFWIPATLFQLLVGGAAVVMLYALVMIPVTLQPPLGDYVRPRLRGLWQKFRKKPDSDQGIE